MKEEEKAVKTLIVDPVNLFVRVVDAPDTIKKAFPPKPGKQPPPNGVNGQVGKPKGLPGGVPSAEPPGPNTADHPAKDGDHILVEGRHAIVHTAGKHGVTAHEADGTEHQKFHGDYEHFNKPSTEEKSRFDFGSGKGEPGDKDEESKDKPNEPNGEHAASVAWNLKRVERGHKPFFTSRDEKEAYEKHKNGNGKAEDKPKEKTEKSLNRPAPDALFVLEDW